MKLVLQNCYIICFTDLDKGSKWLFLSQFRPQQEASFLEVSGAVVKIGLSLKSNHNKQI